MRVLASFTNLRKPSECFMLSSSSNAAFIHTRFQPGDLFEALSVPGAVATGSQPAPSRALISSLRPVGIENSNCRKGQSSGRYMHLARLHSHETDADVGPRLRTDAACSRLWRASVRDSARLRRCAKAQRQSCA